jgi:hypothetical protein
MGKRSTTKERIGAAACLAAAILAASGCAANRVAFTQPIRTQYDLSAEELKNLQYYLAGDVTLQREIRSEEGEISKSHALVRKEGGVVEQVIVRSGTPGIATDVGETTLTVSFEPGASLVFGSPPTDRDPERKYKLTAERWGDRRGELMYGGKTFYAVDWSGEAFLEVVLESLDAVEKKRKVLPGMTLPGK